MDIGAQKMQTIPARCISLNAIDTAGALSALRFQPDQVATVAPELHGLQPESAREWRYIAFELLF